MRRSGRHEPAGSSWSSTRIEVDGSESVLHGRPHRPNDEAMKHTRDADQDIAPEYDFSTGRRGAYLKRARAGIRPITRRPEPTKPPGGEGDPPKPGETTDG